MTECKLEAIFGYLELIIPDPWIYYPIGNVIFTEPFFVMPKGRVIEHKRKP